MRTTPDISVVARRADVGERRLQGLHEAEDVVVRQPVEELDEAHDRLVRDLAQQSQGPLQLRGLQAADEADRAVEQPDEHEERRQPVAEAAEVRVAGVARERRVGVGERLLEDDDDRVALADLALGDDAPEPAPVVADRHVGGAGRSTTPHPPRLRDPLDEAPRLGLGEGEAGRPVAQAQRLADLALRERLAAGHQVGVDAGDRGRDAPRGAHLAPGVGEASADLLGDRGRGAGIERSDGVGHAWIVLRSRNLRPIASLFSPAADAGDQPPAGTISSVSVVNGSWPGSICVVHDATATSPRAAWNVHVHSAPS